MLLSLLLLLLLTSLLLLRGSLTVSRITSSLAVTLAKVVGNLFFLFFLLLELGVTVATVWSAVCFKNRTSISMLLLLLLLLLVPVRDSSAPLSFSINPKPYWDWHSQVACWLRLLPPGKLKINGSNPA